MYSKYFRSTQWEHGQLRVQGVSVAGMGTSLFLPELSVTIDVAQGLPFAFRASRFLITHAHMDHAAGIPYIISQKALFKAPPPIFYMPFQMLSAMKEIMKQWGSIDGHDYNFDFREAEVGSSFPLDDKHEFVPFETFHRVPSVGYTIYEKKRKLKAEFAQSKRHDILKLKQAGAEFTEEIRTPLFSYTGDTTFDFWDKNPHVLESKVLFVEATFWDQKRSISAARQWGHIHIDEILPRLKDFKGEKLVLTHISSRYSPIEVQKIFEAKVPREFRERVTTFPPAELRQTI